MAPGLAEWCGGNWLRCCARRGHEVYAPTLTGLGERKHLLDREISLETHIQDVIGIIDDEDLYEVILVGHSYGGIVISAVADRLPDKIGSLVYLDAIVPENGQSVFNLLQLPSENGFVSPIPSTAFGLKRGEVIAFWEAKSTPQPLATLDDGFFLEIRVNAGPGNCPETDSRCSRRYDRL